MSSSAAALECLRRFRRCALVAAGCSRRLRVSATAGDPTTLFGIGHSAWLRTAVAHARRQGPRAVLRSTFSVEAEAFGCFAAKS